MASAPPYMGSEESPYRSDSGCCIEGCIEGCMEGCIEGCI